MILAISENGVIGINNKLPWHIPADLQHFKQLTKDGVVVMGRNTWESLPKKPLPDRVNVVFTSATIDVPGVYTINSIEALVDLCEAKGFDPSKVWIIGGAKLYKLLLSQNLISKIYLTKINSVVVGDAFIDLSSYLGDFEEPEVLGGGISPNGLAYQFLKYCRLDEVLLILEVFD